MIKVILFDLTVDLCKIFDPKTLENISNMFDLFNYIRYMFDLIENICEILENVLCLVDFGILVKNRNYRQKLKSGSKI